ncbi:hypothetical protein D3C87_1414950 [compost metagenome]
MTLAVPLPIGPDEVDAYAVLLDWDFDLSPVTRLRYRWKFYGMAPDLLDHTDEPLIAHRLDCNQAPNASTLQPIPVGYTNGDPGGVDASNFAERLFGRELKNRHRSVLLNKSAKEVMELPNRLSH